MPVIRFAFSWRSWRQAKALGKKPDFKDRGDKPRAQLRKGLESARAVLDAWLAGL